MTEYKYMQLILQECYSAMSTTVLLCFLLHTAPPFSQFCMLWASLASPNKKRNFNYLSSGRLWLCSSLHRILHIWYLALCTDSQDHLLFQKTKVVALENNTGWALLIPGQSKCRRWHNEMHPHQHPAKEGNTPIRRLEELILNILNND